MNRYHSGWSDRVDELINDAIDEIDAECRITSVDDMNERSWQLVAERLADELAKYYSGRL